MDQVQGAELKAIWPYWPHWGFQVGEKMTIFFNLYFGGFDIYVHILEDLYVGMKKTLHLFGEVSEN